LTIFALAACGTQAPAPTATEPATATQAEPTPTQPPAVTDTVVPATEAPATDTAVAATEAPASSGVSFVNDVQPILNAKCIKCHGVEQVKEGLDIQTYEAIMAGSFNGPVIVPGNANDSLFVQLIVEGEMPNRGTKVTPEELQLIIDWVNQGALNN
jgi:uncharacterized membrane protein